MANLYRVQKDYLDIIGMMEESGGEITEDISIALDKLTDNRDSVIEFMLQERQNHIANETSLANEITRLEERKKSAIKKQESIEQNVIKILKFFDLRSSNKKSKGYAFKSAAFDCFTRTSTNYVLDDLRIGETFKPIVGEKSNFITYTVNKKFTSDVLDTLNKTGLIPVDAYMINIDKKSVNAYMKELEEGKQLEITDTASEVKQDPIAKFAKLQMKESLTVR